MQGTVVHGNKNNYSEGEVISLAQVISFFWRSKIIIASVSAVFAIISVYWVVKLPNQYTAEAILVPSENSASGNMSNIMGQLGGLASIAGIDVGGSSGNEVKVAIEVIQSRYFVQQFIEENNLLPALLASTKWSQEQNKLEFDETKYLVNEQKWVRTPPKDKAVEPTSWEGYQAFIDRLSVDHDIKSNIIYVSFEFYSPYLAKEIVEKLIDKVNQHLRIDSVKELESSIAYLKTESEKTNIAELKAVFFSLIEEQTKQLMLARIRDDYVFKTISPALVAEDKSNPKRAFLCIAITFVGFLFSLIISVIIDSIKQNKKSGIA